MATTPSLDPIETALVDTVRVALTSSPSALRQQVRRLVKSPPGTTHATELKAQLTSLLAAAPADPHGALRRASPKKAPADVPAPMPPHALNVDAEDLPGCMVTMPDPSVRPVLASDVAESVEEVLAERQSMGELLKHGLAPTSKLLLTGPPGVGKTLTAAYVAGRLGLPLMTVDLAALMSSYLGRTAKNLRQLLDDARARECVLFFDEFDAVAKSRSDAQDVGELKRVVNVLLLELEKTHTGFLIAATNHPELLDRAIQRRFDKIISLGMPGVHERISLIQNGRTGLSAGLSLEDASVLALATEGWSHSDIQRKLNELARRGIMEGHGWTGVRHCFMEWALEELLRRGSGSHATRRATAYAAVEVLGFSRRRAAELIGVSHPTVSKLLSEPFSEVEAS